MQNRQKRDSNRAELLDRLGLRHPIIQAPMAGVSTPELAAAVAAAGALGSLALSGGSPEVVETAFDALGPLTNQPINLNFFVHESANTDNVREQAWLNRMQPLFRELDATLPEALGAPYGSFDDNPRTLEALLDHRAPVVSFHFGLPTAATVAALKQQGSVILGTATSVPEARNLVAGGVDMVIAQGWEAGGHRGQFLLPNQRATQTPASSGDECLSTLALLPMVCAAVEVPVIAAGGIGSRDSVAAALAMGAAGVQLGTAFVTCPESSANNAYRHALSEGSADTIMTPVFSGRVARGLANRVTDQLHPFANEAPDYPIAYDAGKQLAAAAAATGDRHTIREYSPFWAGQSYRANRPLPAAELVASLI